MKLILENIGKIKKAEIDLDHQLTVFFGPNNTGKTYVSYCLYGLGKKSPFMGILDDVDSILDINFEELYQTGKQEIDLVERFMPLRTRLKQGFESGFEDYLPQLFGNYSPEQFINSRIELSFFENDSAFKDYIINSVFYLVSMSFYGKPGNIRFERNKEGRLRIWFTEDFRSYFDTEAFKYQVINSLKRSIVQAFQSTIRTAAFIPAERIGISAFGKEFVVNRFSQTNLPKEQENFVLYPLAVFDAIQSQFEMINIKNRTSSERFLSIALEIETEILGGNLVINELGEVFYGDKGKNVLSILNSASTIKSLSSLVFYLRYFANRGGALFIDEPEINLHPENQIKIARVLAKIANLGIKVFVSTHSDYIIREFNNLIMLGKESPDSERLMSEYNYKSNEILNRKKVGAYFFQTDGIVESVEVKETGMEMKGIDDTINNQNRASNDIMWTLFEE